MRTKVLKIVPLVTLLLAFISGFSGFFFAEGEGFRKGI